MKTIAAYTHPAPVSTQEPDTAPGPYYVSIKDGEKFGLLLGPFALHQRALDAVDAARAKAREVNHQQAVWSSFGTCRMKLGFNEPGRLNDLLPETVGLAKEL